MVANDKGMAFDTATSNINKGLIISIICNHCPYVIHIKDKWVQLSNQWVQDHLNVIAINANDPSIVPEDAPERMISFAEENGFEFPYYYDESQAVVKKLRAVCTPEFYLYNSDRQLVYRGQFDDSRPGNNIPVTGNDLANAVHALVSGDPMSSEQKPSSGCNIKWRNWPDYC